MPLHRLPKTAARAGVDARLLAERLAPMQPGEVVTYADLSALIGLDVQERRDLLQTARDVVRQEHGMVFDVERDVGLVCLNSPGMVGYADTKLQRVHRETHRIKHVLDCVEPEALTPLEKHRWLAQQSTVAAVALFTHTRTITQGGPQAVPELPPVDYLEKAREVFRR